MASHGETLHNEAASILLQMVSPPPPRPLVNLSPPRAAVASVSPAALLTPRRSSPVLPSRARELLSASSTSGLALQLSPGQMSGRKRARSTHVKQPAHVRGGIDKSQCASYCARSGWCANCTKSRPPATRELAAMSPASSNAAPPNSVFRTERLYRARAAWKSLLEQVPPPGSRQVWLPPREIVFTATEHGILPSTALALRQSYAVCSTEQARGGGQSATAELCAVLSAVGSTFIASVDESLQRSMVGFPPAAPRNFMPLAQQTVIATSRCLP